MNNALLRLIAATLLAGQYIGDAAWQAQIEYCLTHADGVTIWGGSQQAWNPTASWWTIMRKFLP